MNNQEFKYWINLITYMTQILCVMLDFIYFSYIAFLDDINVFLKIKYLVFAFIITGLFSFAIGIILGFIL